MSQPKLAKILKVSILVLFFISFISVAAYFGWHYYGAITVKAYEKYLSTLNPKDINVITKSIKFYHAKLDSLPKKQQEEAFIKFRKFYEKYIKAQDKIFEKSFSERYFNIESTPEMKSYEKTLEENGLKIEAGDGASVWVTEKPKFLYNTFKNHVTPPMREFLKTRLTMDEVFGWKDLYITYEELGNLTVAWELFLQRNPDFVYKDEVEYSYKIYLATFMQGLSYTPVFGISGEYNYRVLPDMQVTYKNFKTKYPKTKTGRLIQEYYDFLQANSFYHSELVEIFFDKHGIQSIYNLLYDYQEDDDEPEYFPTDNPQYKSIISAFNNYKIDLPSTWVVFTRWYAHQIIPESKSADLRLFEANELNYKYLGKNGTIKEFSFNDGITGYEVNVGNDHYYLRKDSKEWICLYISAPEKWMQQNSELITYMIKSIRLNE